MRPVRGLRSWRWSLMNQWNLRSYERDPSELPTAIAKSLQSCPNLCDPIDSSLPGSPRPWDSPGKNTSGLPFPSPWKWKVKVKSLSRVPDPQRPHGLQPSRLLCPWDFPGKSTGVGCHCLLEATVKRLPSMNQEALPNTESLHHELRSSISRTVRNKFLLL